MNLKLPLLLGCCLLVATTTCAGTSGSLGEDAPGKTKRKFTLRLPIGSKALTTLLKSFPKSLHLSL